MIQKVLKGSISHVLLLAALLLSGFVLIGCGSGGGGGSDDYDEPAKAATTPVVGQDDNVLITAATLKSWIDAGDVNKEGDYNKVVILDFYSDYTAGQGWIPGAIKLGLGDVRESRVEGVALMTAMVGTGEQMDALIAAAGITSNTTIVLTSNTGSTWAVPRLYWALSYWGFDASRLKVLSGGNAAFDANYDLVWQETEASSSDGYSVRDNVLQPNLRASIGEMIVDVAPAVKAGTELTIDCRGSASFSGAPKTSAYIDKVLITDDTVAKATNTVMEGHVSGGTYINTADLYEVVDGLKVHKSVADLGNVVLGNGETLAQAVAKYDKITGYCNSGHGAGDSFFALGVLLGGNVQIYDGSMSQWMQYAEITTDANSDGVDDLTGAMLPIGTQWSVEGLMDHLLGYVSTGTVVEGPAYNALPTSSVPVDNIEQLRYLSEQAEMYPSPLDLPNQIEASDLDYIDSVPYGTDQAGLGVDSGAGC